MTSSDANELPYDDNENLDFNGYKRNGCKTAITYFLYAITLGFLRLFFHWFPTWHLYATHSKCSLRDADKVLITDLYHSLCKIYFVEEVEFVTSPDRGRPLVAYLEDGSVHKNHQLRVVRCKKLCYVWSGTESKFLRLVGLDVGQKCADYYSFAGYSEDERNLRLATYGENDINVPLDTILSLFFLEALTPFYFFQVFSLIVWFLDEYYYYAVAIIIMSVVGIATSVLQTRKNQQSLKNTIASCETVSVRANDGAYHQILSHRLVPGDVIEIPSGGCVMQCDAVLVNGNCTVNESMLTGESIPVTKTPIPKTGALYKIQEDAFHTLFSGTKVIQTRVPPDQKVLAVVIRTGFLTSKGELVRAILFPTPSDFKFDQDSYKVLIVLAIVAFIGAIYTVVSKSTRSIEVGYIFLKALDLITVVIPPALPATITIGKLYALHRLKKKEIFCINSKVINVSGSVDCMCFDKTGTLTEDGLDMWGVVGCDDQKLTKPLRDVDALAKSSKLLHGMATCHSLTIIEDRIMGDPLDEKMFESTGWCLEENSTTHTAMVKHNGNEFEILHRFPFSSRLQRMSVICASRNSDALQVFCKGSPEMISSLSVAGSVPCDLREQLKTYTRHGYRVIAMGSRTISKDRDIATTERATVECDLSFDGLIIFENRIKPVTAGVIKMLKDAHIKTVMITGDNMETALSVAVESGIVERDENVVVVDVDQSVDGELRLLYSVEESSKLDSCFSNDVILPMSAPNVRYAMSGASWKRVQMYFPQCVDELVREGVVFARMSGLQKQQVIQELKKQGYYTGMCGDGANDCGALKTSHVGISLSKEEASVASPFTAKQNDISCVEEVIREGRAALATSMGIFKFMICYSITQFTSAIILYGIDDNLTSLQFLFVDIVIVLNLISTFGRTKPSKGALSKERLEGALLSLTSVSSIISQILFVIIFQASAYNLIHTYSWFTPFHFDQNNVLALSSYENYAVYVMSLFQYIIMIIAFSKGEPYRRAIYTNKILFCDVILMTTICLYILFYPANWVKTVLDLKVPPGYNFNLVVLAFAIANFICAFIAEDLIVGYVLAKKVYPKLYQLFRRRAKCSNKAASNDYKVEKSNGFINRAYNTFDGET
uniref:Cation-transporting ATPase n=1 Tax=Photinus pyralis TaxID=7054 RepID=A0A1Y1K7X3_PHOPY